MNQPPLNSDAFAGNKGYKIKCNTDLNKAIIAVNLRRNNLIRELKETNNLLFQLKNQLDIDAEYRKLNTF